MVVTKGAGRARVLDRMERRHPAGQVDEVFKPAGLQDGGPRAQDHAEEDNVFLRGHDDGLPGEGGGLQIRAVDREIGDERRESRPEGDLYPVAIPRAGVGGGVVSAPVDAGREIEEKRSWHLGTRAFAIAAVHGRMLGGVRAEGLIQIVRMHPLLLQSQPMDDWSSAGL